MIDYAKNDFLNNGVTDPRHPNFRFNGPNVRAQKKPMPPEILSALADEARRLGRGLTDAERDAIYARFD